MSVYSNVPDDKPEKMRAALEAVLDLHKPFRVYEDCGHNHDDYAEDGGKPDGVIERLDGVLVCDANVRTVCMHCCCTGEFGLTEECMSAHGDEFHDPCSTVRVIAEKLGIEVGS